MQAVILCRLLLLPACFLLPLLLASSSCLFLLPLPPASPLHPYASLISCLLPQNYDQPLSRIGSRVAILRVPRAAIVGSMSRVSRSTALSDLLLNLVHCSRGNHRVFPHLEIRHSLEGSAKQCYRSCFSSNLCCFSWEAFSIKHCVGSLAWAGLLELPIHFTPTC